MKINLQSINVMPASNKKNNQPTFKSHFRFKLGQRDYKEVYNFSQEIISHAKKYVKTAKMEFNPKFYATRSGHGPEYIHLEVPNDNDIFTRTSLEAKGIRNYEEKRNIVKGKSEETQIFGDLAELLGV